MSFTLARLLGLLFLITLASCGPSDVQPLDIDPAAIRAPDADLSDEVVRASATIALSGERLDDLLADHLHHVGRVAAADAFPSRAIVTVAYDQPLDDAEYPLNRCTIDTDGQPITGPRWLIDAADMAAVSPRWGADRYCGNRPRLSSGAVHDRTS